MNMVDDATGTTRALLASGETTRAAMELLWQWIDKYGVPAALYTDYNNVFVTKREPTLEEHLKGEEPLTQFGRACKKLGIRIIPANSPQAKGRVERSNGVYQDRLVKEMRLQGIDGIAEANEFLSGSYLDGLNRRFAVAAREVADYHRPLAQEIDLKAVFCFEERRSIANDWTVRYRNRFYQIKKQSKCPPAKDKLVVQEHLDGTIHLVYRGQEVEFVELGQRREIKRKDLPVVNSSRRKYMPPADHPWRSFVRVRCEV